MKSDVDMQTIVQVQIYRVRDDAPEYLLLLRGDEGTPFWQPVSQAVSGETLALKALEAAMQSQAGISSHKRLSQPIHTYEWYASGQQGKDIVFAAEVEPDTEARVDGQQFTDHAWLPFNQAVQQVKWNGNKEALRILQAAVGVELEQQANARQVTAAEAARQAEAERQFAQAAEADAARRAKMAAEIREAVATPVPLMYRQPEPKRPAPPPLPDANRPAPMVIPLPVYNGPDATPPPETSSLPIAPAPAFRRPPHNAPGTYRPPPQT